MKIPRAFKISRPVPDERNETLRRAEQRMRCIANSIPLQGPELFKLNEPHVRSALAGEAQHFERRLPNPDGTASTVDVQYRPDVDENGAVRGFYVLVTDITAIQTARDAAVKLAAAKTDFLANMSHEIRTPLNGILGMTQLLLNTPLSSEQREFAATAQSSGEHLLGIVDDVLDFSRIESGRLLLESSIS